jgi:hypothetical protein
MAGMAGEIVYYKDGSYIPFQPCDQWNAKQPCQFVVGEFSPTFQFTQFIFLCLYQIPKPKPCLCFPSFFPPTHTPSSHFPPSPSADEKQIKSDILSLGTLLYAARVLHAISVCEYSHRSYPLRSRPSSPPLAGA